MRERIRKHAKLGITAAALLVLSLLCLLLYAKTSGTLLSQRAAERWQGESEDEFAQISAFMPVDGRLTLEQVYTFRQAMATKLHEAALDIDNEDLLISDAWSAFGKLPVRSEHGKGEVAVTAVGGSFFDFHPLTLLSGSYLSPDELMKDRVLLDEETAWLLFGGTELEGMSFKINDQTFVVGGVVRREDDRFSKAAYSEGMGIFMSYDAYLALNDAAGIDCYEIILPQPVKGFAYSAVSEKFPLGTGELVDNSTRYGGFRLLKMLKDFGGRSMHASGVRYPYWENAARGSEDMCMALLALSLLFALLPLVLLSILAVSGLKRGKARLEEETLPTLKERVSEAVRVRQRRRWEKKHELEAGRGE